MRFSTGIAACISTVAYIIVGANGHSQARNPLNYLALIENPRIHTYNQRVYSHSRFDITFDVHNNAEHYRLSLEPNDDILGDDSYVNYLDKHGNVERVEKMNRADHKVYQGKALVVDEDGMSSEVGFARISVRRDGVVPVFEGVFSVNGNHHHVQLKSNYMTTKHVMDPHLEESDDEYMVVYRDTDVSSFTHSELRKRTIADKPCGSDELAFNIDAQHPVHAEILSRSLGSWGQMSPAHIFGKRQTTNIDGGGQGNGNSAGVNLRSTIGDTTGCPKSRKVALVGIATDCSYTAQFNSSQSLQNNLVSVVNMASDVYVSSFNITLGLRNLTVSPAECPATPAAATKWNAACSDSYTIEDRLNDFSAWRGNLQGDTNAYWSLFTTCNTGAEVGLAWLGQLCNHGGTDQSSGSNTQTVTGANVVSRTSNEWQVFAHESGHTFGAVHDCDSSTCQNTQAVSASQCCPFSSSGCDAQAGFIMNPYSVGGISKFSPCTIGNICSAIGRNSVQSSCLTDNRGVVTITGSQCGNGIVEEGEDCDCGGEAGCAGDSCCNPTTCKFTTNSVCDPSNDGCCTSQCQFSSSGTVCRASSGPCDPQETCTGTQAACPPDETTKDGTDCGSGLQCASGQCTSRDQQCKTVMGSYTEGNDTYSCNSQGCSISCASPDFGRSVCYSVQQNFLDGTPCGGGGSCNNGVCKGSTAGGEIKSWIQDNKTLVIALASALGGLLLLAILGCCISACRRRKQPKKVAFKPSRHQPWNGPAIPPNMVSRGYGAPNQTWYPQQPPPSYGNQGFQYGQGGPSVRYA